MLLSDINKLVINLPSRINRYNQFLQEIEYLCAGDQVKLINGIEMPIPMEGIAAAHISCIMLAKSNGWDSVLIMEDDVLFQGKMKTLLYITEALASVPNDWDMLLGGLYDSNGLSPVNDYWNKTRQFCGLHFYIARSTIYDHILNWEGKCHIDRWINFHSDKNIYVAKKFFAIQRDGFSDNSKSKTDYSQKLRKFKLL